MAGSLEHYQMMVNLLPKLSRIGEKDAGRATILCLYCANQVNSGRIKNCADWKNRDWLLEVGISSRPKDLEGFWHWEGNDLFIDIYNWEAEVRARGTSEARRDAARIRWEKQRAAQATEPKCKSNANASTKTMQTHSNCNATCNAEKRREEKRINSSSSSMTITKEEEEEEDLWRKVISLNSTWQGIPARTAKEDQHWPAAASFLKSLSGKPWAILRAVFAARQETLRKHNITLPRYRWHFLAHITEYWEAFKRYPYDPAPARKPVPIENIKDDDIF